MLQNIYISTGIYIQVGFYMIYIYMATESNIPYPDAVSFSPRTATGRKSVTEGIAVVG